MHTAYGSVADALSYYHFGEGVARFVSLDIKNNAGELLKLIFQQDARIPATVYGVGSPTGTMTGIAALLVLTIGGAWPSTVAVSLFSYSGQVAAYSAMRTHFGRAPIPIAVGMLLVPSVVFWTSSLQKETLAVAGLGWLVFALVSFMQKRVFRGVVIGVMAAGLVALTKPYVLLPAAMAAGVWFYWRQAAGGTGPKIRPMWLVLAFVFTAVAIAALGSAFPQFAFERFADEAAARRHAGGLVGGGSYFEIGSVENTGFWSLMALAPMGLLSALFRPSVFDVKNSLMAVNAFETSLLTVLMVVTAVRFGFRGAGKKVAASPALVFFFVFTVVFALAVGLTTTNLGTLSRYRVPMMPFFATLVAALAIGRQKRRVVVLRQERPPASA
ncbi:MAG: hypothetical protein KC766_17325 [Myxococcales bacterium]|nr:hypothetical protein [Myxococcales bacterium]